MNIENADIKQSEKSFAKPLQQQINETFQLIELNNSNDDAENNLACNANANNNNNNNKLSSHLRKKSLSFLASIKNSTLSASRILTFKSSNDNAAASKDAQLFNDNPLLSNSQTALNCRPPKEPIDLEARISFDENQKVKHRLVANRFKKKSDKNSTKSESNYIENLNSIKLY